MAISKRLRYELLRRDEHTCQYCGESAPDVTLHIDHVVPVTLGGTDDPGNLVTACKDCNAGKTSIPADAPLVKKVSEHSAAYALAMTDKMTRIRAHLEASNELLVQFDDAWNDWWMADTKESIPLPDEYKDGIRRWAQMGVPFELIQFAIEKAMRKKGIRGEFGVFQYMAGIVWRTLDDHDAPSLTEAKVAVYTASEYEENVTEERITAYLHGWDTGYEVGFHDGKGGYLNRLENPQNGT